MIIVLLTALKEPCVSFAYSNETPLLCLHVDSEKCNEIQKVYKSAKHFSELLLLYDTEDTETPNVNLSKNNNLSTNIL